MSNTKSTVAVRVIEETPAYWRATFDHPPFNILDDTIFEGLQDLIARMEVAAVSRKIETERRPELEES